ncbi:DUF2232 domain-containing protein [Phormidium sp. CCY1219]|uniref:DUF2232 domain-containing protein n=1 Tax=Phormidium sp. CCY1219 TaxID=2886104 RepID=UPI002D1F1C6D|nr:DUF2232 domain-containing protein [Phormidium sp. CCY1219]MEB3831651.1 DUF2232 domain-containing protein [Phormidium sp. CCY1219]
MVNSPDANNNSTPTNTNRSDSDDTVTPSDRDSPETSTPIPSNSNPNRSIEVNKTLILVETAFLSSTSCLIWLINYYFPLGPVLRIFFPVPIALVYLRWGNRAAWMAAVVSGLLLSVLMGPTRSILFVMPFGFLGVLLGCLWRRRASWGTAILLGCILGSLGFFFRLWLLGILVGEDLWVYLTTQITELAQWIFLKLGLLVQPSLYFVQGLAVVLVAINNLIYLFAVHLAAALLLEKLGNPIPPPPPWVDVLLDEE